MGLLDRLKNAASKALGRELEKKVDSGIHNLFNKKSTKTKTEEPSKPVETPVAQPEVKPVEDNTNAEVEALKKQNEMMANMMAAQAMSSSVKASRSSMSEVNEMMSYFEFDSEMNVIGVKADAPDWVKLAYQNRDKED